MFSLWAYNASVSEYEHSSNELWTNVFSQVIWHWTSLPVRAVHTGTSRQISLMMVACQNRRALSLQWTRGGRWTSNYWPISTVSQSPTTAMIISVIIAEFTVFINYLIIDNIREHNTWLLKIWCYTNLTFWSTAWYMSLTKFDTKPCY